MTELTQGKKRLNESSSDEGRNSRSPARSFFSDLALPLGTALMLTVGSEKASAGHHSKWEGNPEPTHNTAVRADALKISLYMVQKGDTLSEIAKRFNVTQEYLRAANPGLDPNKLSIGQALRLPVTPEFHIVKQGDTLSRIAHDNGIELHELIEANAGLNPKNLRIGQNLALPSAVRIQITPSASEKKSTPPTSKTHTVQSGQNLTKIAHLHGMKLKDLQDANPGIDPGRLKVGQTLTLPNAATIHSSLPTSSSNTLKVPQATPQKPNQTEQVPPPTQSTTRLNDPRFCSPLSSEESPSFFTFLKRALGFEGMKIQRDEHDRGNQGPAKLTNCGVTGIAVAQHIKDTQKRNASPEEISHILETLSLDEAVVVYATGYWRKEYQALPPKVAFIMFDWGINSHPKTVVGEFQKTLGLPSNGALDQRTIAAINSLEENGACRELIKCRENFYTRLAAARPHDQRHLKGWLNRTHAALEFANSEEFKELKAVFEKTAKHGCDLFDPVRVGHTLLKRNSKEHTLIRHLQERLTKAGYELATDSFWGPEMDRVVTFFKEKHRLPGGPTWGVTETQVLDALLNSKTHSPQIAANFSGLVIPPRLVTHNQ
jgi:LysM repeat protein